MQEVVCDEKGRIVLPKQVREAFGRRFVIVPALGEILLLPIPRDPVKRLGELGRKAGISQMSLSQLKRSIAEEASRQSNVRRH